ncbi:putative sporulation protein YtxC [Clostridium hydrogenum]|uniref:putative sporulation protein YtxC n=1 Tax=Clostridium hydrogenum TaxID=2855764 RepID=UPI002E2EEE92|nr:putative sporulation protein YtxC [Clostridium hydrogenum]
MLLETIVCGNKSDSIINNINSIVCNFEKNNIRMGMSESIDNNIHFVNVICRDEDYNENIENKFYYYLSEVLYKYTATEFCSKKLENKLKSTYFFLGDDEIKDVKHNCIQTMLKDIPVNDNGIYFINRKNQIIQKINDCIKENHEININGFVTFRTKEIENEFDVIIDKIVENYMVEKEYDEFIKLLKYFVDIQESKIDELNIYVDKYGNYLLKDKYGKDIENKIIEGLCDVKTTGAVSIDDILISGLITLSPKKIIIHSRDNFKNKELIETIEKVFESKVAFCDM